MNELFSTEEFVTTAEWQSMRCKSCKHLVRHHYEGRWIYASCGIRSRGSLNYRVKPTQKACPAFEKKTIKKIIKKQ